MIHTTVIREIQFVLSAFYSTVNQGSPLPQPLSTPSLMGSNFAPNNYKVTQREDTAMYADNGVTIATKNYHGKNGNES